MTKEIPIKDVKIGGGNKIVLIAGPCVIESEDHALALGRAIAAVAAEVFNVPPGHGCPAMLSRTK